MGPFLFPDPIAVNIMKDWLLESREIFVEVYRPHSGSGGTVYVLNNFSQFDDLVTKCNPGSLCFVLRDKQLQIRGRVDDAFIDQALEEIADGQKYRIIEPNRYPQAISSFGQGNSHSELEHDLRELQGLNVWTGFDFCFPENYWIEDFTDNKLIISLLE